MMNYETNNRNNNFYINNEVYQKNQSPEIDKSRFRIKAISLHDTIKSQNKLREDFNQLKQIHQNQLEKNISFHQKY